MGVIHPAQLLEALLAFTPADLPGLSSRSGRNAGVDSPRQAGLKLAVLFWLNWSVTMSHREGCGATSGGTKKRAKTLNENEIILLVVTPPKLTLSMISSDFTQNLDTGHYE